MMDSNEQGFYFEIDANLNGAEHGLDVNSYSIEYSLMIKWLYDTIKKAAIRSTETCVWYYVYFVNSRTLQKIPGKYLYIGPDKPQDGLPWEILDPRAIDCSVGAEQYPAWFHNRIENFMKMSPVLRNLDRP